MKKIIILLVFVTHTALLAKGSKATTLDTLWYDKDYKITDKQNAFIYKVRCYLINKKYIHVYFFKSNNRSHLISYSLDEFDLIYDGKRTFYYESGKTKNVISYKNNKKEGEYLEYYESAKLYLKGAYCDDKKVGQFIVKDKKGKLLSKEFWDDGKKRNNSNSCKAIAMITN